MSAIAMLRVVQLAGRFAVPAAGAAIVTATVLQTVLLYKLERSLRRYGESAGDELDWMA